jgi:Flp pilus assembly protein TadD
MEFTEIRELLSKIKQLTPDAQRGVVEIILPTVTVSAEERARQLTTGQFQIDIATLDSATLHQVQQFVSTFMLDDDSPSAKTWPAPADLSAFESNSQVPFMIATVPAGSQIEDVAVGDDALSGISHVAILLRCGTPMVIKAVVGAPEAFSAPTEYSAEAGYKTISFQLPVGAKVGDTFSVDDDGSTFDFQVPSGLPAIMARTGWICMQKKMETLHNGEWINEDSAVLAPAKSCAYCGCSDPPPRSRCSRCKTTWFCNKQCHKKAWPKHKLACRPQITTEEADKQCTVAKATFDQAAALLSPVEDIDTSESQQAFSTAEAAKALLTRSIHADPGNIAAHHLLGVAMSKLGDRSGAITAFERAIARGGHSNPLTYDHLGTTLKRTGNMERAKSCFKHAIKLMPDQPNFHTHLANLHMDLGETSCAIREFELSVSLDPNDDPFTLVNYGLALHGLGDLSGAIAAHRKACQADPRDTKARDNLRILLGQLKGERERDGRAAKKMAGGDD